MTPNVPNIFGRTPIYYAAQSGRVEILKLLMTNAESPNAPDNIGHTPIHTAARKGYIEVVKLLMPTTENPNAPTMHLAKVLISATKFLNVPDNAGDTPLTTLLLKEIITTLQLYFHVV